MFIFIGNVVVESSVCIKRKQSIQVTKKREKYFSRQEANSRLKKISFLLV